MNTTKHPTIKSVLSKAKSVVKKAVEKSTCIRQKYEPVNVHRLEVSGRNILHSNRFVPIGMPNLGLSCYANSVLQAIIHCPPMMAFVSNKYLETLSTSEELSQDSHFATLFLKLAETVLCHSTKRLSFSKHTTIPTDKDDPDPVTGHTSKIRYNQSCCSCTTVQCGIHRILHGESQATEERRKRNERLIDENFSGLPGSAAECTVSPKALVDFIAQRDPDLGIGGRGMHDAHELMVFIIHCLFSLGSQMQMNVNVNVPTARTNYFLNRLNQLFSGSTVTSTECLTCGSSTRIKEKSVFLQVYVAPNTSLGQCIVDTLKEERLQNDALYHCQGCGERREAIRKTRLERTASVLLIQLSLFEYDLQVGMKKKAAKIKIPLSQDMESFHEVDCTNPPQNPDRYTYHLSGVVSHIGESPLSGHYVSYIKNWAGDWFKCDDKLVQHMSTQQLRRNVLDASGTESPYLLIYYSK